MSKSEDRRLKNICINGGVVLFGTWLWHVDWQLAGLLLVIFGILNIIQEL